MVQLEERDCTLCGKSAKKHVKFPATFDAADLNAEIFSARRSPDLRHFQLMECESCGMIFSDPACGTDELSSLYKAAMNNYDAQEPQIYASYAPVLDRALQLLPPADRDTFVEIGGGRGFMLRYGKEHGFKKTIEVEPSEDAEKRFEAPDGNARFVRGLFMEGTLPKSSASLICGFQMLDHVPNPGAFIRTCFDVLEPGGVAVFVTHNTKALSAKILGERSPIYDIEHTYLFHPGNMKSLLAQSGFAACDTFAVSNRYAVRHWLNLAPLPKPLKRGTLHALEASRLADVPINLRAGNFGIVGRKPRAPKQRA